MSQHPLRPRGSTLRRTPLPAAVAGLLLALLVLTGCGGGDEEPKDSGLGPVSDETSTAAPSASADPDASAGEDTPFDDEGHEVLRGTVEATTPEEEAVADAWFAYWEVRVKSFAEVQVDPMAGSVAAGEALADVVRYVATLRSKNLRTVGDIRFGVTDLEMQGTSATLRSCGENKSVDRDRSGEPAEALTPFYNLEGTLTQAGGSWRVVDVEVVGTNGCRA